MLMRNPEVMLLDTFEDPQFIHDLMRFATDYCKRWGDAIVKTKIGLSFSEPTASISLISPDNYREFIAPYHKELVDYFKAKKVGPHHPHLRHDVPDLRGPDRAAGSRPSPSTSTSRPIPSSTSTSSRGSWQVARGRAVAIGNVDATLFERATQAEIEAEVRRCIDTAARHSGFILSTSCEIPPRSKPEIVQWFMDATREYGRYERFMS